MIKILGKLKLEVIDQIFAMIILEEGVYPFLTIERGLERVGELFDRNLITKDQAEWLQITINLLDLAQDSQDLASRWHLDTDVTEEVQMKMENFCRAFHSMDIKKEYTM